MVSYLPNPALIAAASEASVAIRPRGRSQWDTFVELSK